MPVLTQRSFTGGEISPSLRVRVDLGKYQSSLAKVLNIFIHVEGGGSNRTGFEFVSEVKDSTKETRLIEFEFNTEQAYALEFSDRFMRPIINGGQVTNPDVVITGITQANPAVVSAPAHGYANADEVFISSVVGMTEVNQKNFIIANVTVNTFELVGIDSTGYIAYIGGGTVARIYTLTTAYTESILGKLRFTQNADTMTLVEAGFDPSELTRTGHDAWVLDTIDFAPTQDPPAAPSLTAVGTASTSNNKTYEYVVTAVNTDGDESLPSAAASRSQNALSPTYGIRVTWVAPAGTIAHYNVYKAESFSANVYGFIGKSESLSFEDFNIGPDMAVGPPEASTPFDGIDNKPSTVNYYQQRIVYAATNNNPQQVFTSESGNPHSLRAHSPLIDSDSLKFSLASKKVNKIRHIVAIDALLTLTSGGEWRITEGADEVLSPSTVGFKQQSYNGASDIEPLVIDANALYVQDKGSRVRDIGYTFESNSYTGSDLTLLARHLFVSTQKIFTIVDWTYQKEPYGIVWAVRSDGKLLSFTYQREQQVWAWCVHETDGKFESCTSIPEGLEDVLYVIVRRKINGVYKRYNERLHSRQIPHVSDAFFVDCGLTYDNPSTITGITAANPVVVTDVAHGYSNGDQVHIQDVDGMPEVNWGRYLIASVTANTYELQTLQGVNVDGTAYGTYIEDGTSRQAINTVSNLDHIEGKGIACLADGAVINGLTVTNGSVTLPKKAAKIHIGLPYVSDMETLDIDAAERTTRAVKKNVSTVYIDFNDSRGGFVGPDEDNLLEIKPRDVEDGYGIIPLRSRKETISIAPSWSDGGRIFFRQVDPLPFTVLAITPEFDTA